MAITKPTVWVVGDSMLDVTVRSSAFRRSPEDPAVPVLTAEFDPGSECAAGGAANVAMNLASLGCDVRLFSMIGSDLPGRRLRLILPDAVTPHWATDGRTTTKTRFYESGRLIARVDADVTVENYPQPTLDRILEGPHGMAAPDAIILTDYGRGAITRESIKLWHQFADRYQIMLFADPKQGRVCLWAGLRDVFMVANWVEALELTGQSGHLDRPSFTGLDHTMVKSLTAQFARVIVKRGRHGSSLLVGDQHSSIPAVHPQQVFDVQGAGDTYIAALVAAKCRGAGGTAAALFASAAAGVAVGRPGTVAVQLPHVVEALRDDTDFADPIGVMELIDAETRAHELAACGFRIGLTNGCFDLDLPHPGHLKVIQAAAARCDFLFVGVDSDARVRMLKGDSRPLHTQSERALAMGALRGVGASFVFDQPMDAIVKRIRPDVLVKGGDYREKGVPEAEHLAAWGGRLHLVDLVPTPSTTARLASVPAPEPR